MQYTEILKLNKIKIFTGKKKYIFLNFAQNIHKDCEHTNTHNLCFGAKLRKIGIPLHTLVLLYKSVL